VHPAPVLAPALAPQVTGHSYGAWLALSYALHAPDQTRALALLDPTQCFAGYLLRGLPVLARPTAARQQALLRWETGGAPLNPAWLHLAGLAADLPWSRPVVTRRPSRARLGNLAVPTLVVLAEQSKARTTSAGLRPLPARGCAGPASRCSPARPTTRSPPSRPDR
jgi:pimeloyl-ACP methyl ester carboxylesterase